MWNLDLFVLFINSKFQNYLNNVIEVFYNFLKWTRLDDIKLTTNQKRLN